MRGSRRSVFVQFAGVGITAIKANAFATRRLRPGDDFRGRGLSRWEAAFDSVDASKTRKVLLRLGVVLGPNGGFSTS